MHDIVVGLRLIQESERLDADALIALLDHLAISINELDLADSSSIVRLIPEACLAVYSAAKLQKDGHTGRPTTPSHMTAFVNQELQMTAIAGYGAPQIRERVVDTIQMGKTKGGNWLLHSACAALTGLCATQTGEEILRNWSDIAFSPENRVVRRSKRALKICLEWIDFHV